MEKKHFELTAETKVNIFGVTLFRIKATVKTKYANVGDIGGWVEKLDNLSGDAWVSGNAEVSGDAEVYGNARVSGDARVSGNAEVYGDAWVSGNARVSGDAEVSGNAEVYGDAEVSGNAEVSGDAEVSGNADYCCFQSFGSGGRTTTVFREKSGNIRIRCGCFNGDLEAFSKKVEHTHGDSQYGKVYKAIIEVIKLKFGITNGN